MVKINHTCKTCLRTILFIAVLLVLHGFNNFGWGQTQTFTTSGTFTVPAGVTQVTVECWGGGGSGGGNTSDNSKGGGGGAGGAYALKVISVVPGNDYTVTVASVKTGTNGAGASGNPSWFGTVGTIYAEGGAGGSVSNGGTATGGSGSSTLCIGDVVFAGGNGANGTSTLGGAGGGGAGSTGSGGNASTTTSGTGTSTGGGSGGAGRTNEGNGNNGSTAGGGGAGAYIPDGSNHSGGNGAAGQVNVSWPIISIVPSNLNLGYVASGGTSSEYTYSISGVNLTGAPGNIIVTAPSNFEVSLTSGSGFGTTINVPYSSATLSARTIYTRFKPTAANTNYSGNITNSGGGAAVQNVAVTGTSSLNYCIPTSTTGTVEGDYISLVQLGSINNSTLGLPSPYYYYYNTLSTDISLNASYTITLRAGTYTSANNITVWIDYNQNGTFETAEKLGNVTLLASPATGTINFTVPSGAILGTTRMRVRETWNNTNLDPCTANNYGETEDYNLNVISPCTLGISATATTTCLGSPSGTGTITALGNGGVVPYVYSLNGGTYQSSGLFTTLSAGTYTITVKDNLNCTASTDIIVTEPTTSPDDQNITGNNSWIGHMYDGLNHNTYYGYYNEAETFDQNFGGDLTCFEVNSSLGNRSIYTATYSVRYRMNSTRKGLYIADLGSDDGSRLSVDGMLVYNNWTDQSFSSRPRVLMSLTGTSSLIYDFNENGGQNRVVFNNFIPVLSNTLNSNITQNICLGSSGSTISGDVFGTLPSGITLSGTTGYQWAYSTASSSGPWTNITGATAATYTPSTAVAPFNTPGTYYFIRKASLSSTNNVSPNPYTATNESNTATINVSMAVSTPVFILGATSSRCKSSGSVIYTATATNASGITYSLDAASLTGGNSIVAATGEVTYVAGWSGVSIITASAAGCNGPVTASHSATTISVFSWTGSINTDWNTSGNWYCGVIPDLTTNVQIPNVTNKPILSSGAAGKAKNIDINNGSSLTVVGNTMQIAGTITNSGTFTATAGTIEMKGSAAQVIGSDIFAGNTILNLNINNSAGVTLQGPLNITGSVVALNGNLSSAGNLTLVSTATQTALIDGTGTGQILGNVTMQRYLPSGYGYKYISSPFQAATVNELSNDLTLTASFPTFYKYDEDNHRDSSGILIYSTGWVKYTTGSAILEPMKGYAGNFGNVAAPKTIDITGVVNNNITSTENLFNNARKYTKGFNLVGNPYPSPIDWDATSGWTKINIDDAVYFFDAGTSSEYTGTYSSYINGASTGSANNIIPSMQGFFVHVTDGYTGTFGMNNLVRVNNLSPAYHKSVSDNFRPMVRLSASYENGENRDAAIVYFNDLATEEFDSEFDALKLMNTDVSVPNLYTLTPLSERTSISAIPYPSDSITRTPLGLKTEKDTWVVFTASDIENIPGGIRVYLSDEATGLIQDLQMNPEYRVNLDRGTVENRFALLFSEKELVNIPKNADIFYASLQNGKLTIFAELAVGNEAQLVISNMLGQVMGKNTIYGDGSHEIDQHLPTGMYLLTLYTQKGICSKKIFIPN